MPIGIHSGNSTRSTTAATHKPVMLVVRLAIVDTRSTLVSCIVQHVEVTRHRGGLPTGR